jgi:transcriptional regulator with XRE-family HTH domain
MIPPGLRLRRTRENLGLTYRDVERASYGVAAIRGRQEFVLRISRLADIENRDVVPSIHKLYSLATIYHVNPIEISGWYEAPLQNTFSDGAGFPAPKTFLNHEALSPAMPLNRASSFRTEETRIVQETPELLDHFPHLRQQTRCRYRCGGIGLADRRMVPLLRPGSIVLVDTSLRRIEDAEWSSEYDRPLYFVELREGFRCGWFQKDGSRLIMQPHRLSRCTPEAWRTPDDAEVVGQVVGVVTYFNEPFSFSSAQARAMRPGSTEKAL